MSQHPDVDQDPTDVFEDKDQTALMVPGAEVDVEKSLARFDAAVELRNRLVPASIKATRAQDWVVMGREKVYLQATGAERIMPLWGIVIGRLTVEREEYKDGSYAYIVYGPCRSRISGVEIHYMEGSRASNDKFFVKEKKDNKGNVIETIPPNPLDIRKSAVTNCITGMVTKLAGLRGLTLADLSSAGIDPNNVPQVDFKEGAKGGKKAEPQTKVVEEGVVCVHFGANGPGGDKAIKAGYGETGLPITKMGDKQRQWYIENAQKNIDSDDYAEKGKYHGNLAKEQAFLKALLEA